MPTQALILQILLCTVVLSPFALAVVLGVSALLEISPSERRTARLIFVAIVSGLIAAVAVLVIMLAQGTRIISMDLGNWVVIPGYHFSIKFLFDRLSIPFAILSFILTGTIGAFGSRYMHREPGYNRFFALYAIFVLGMIVASLAGTIETLFAGWELVGLSSAMLVAFFQDRPAPASNGLWVWIVYRVSDASLLLASVVMHHLSGEGDFGQLLGTAPWPDEHTSATFNQALMVGSLLLLAAAGKSALVPFSGWLPRAMEGPTPSSAVFYGALSVHLGAYLLLRVSPLLDVCLPLAVAVVIVGITTAVFAHAAGSVQTDIKSALSFASLSQVGIIVAEIGCGLRYIPLIHILGHACLRTLQFVRAPTLLQDYHTLENAIGDRLPRGKVPWARRKVQSANTLLYRVFLERGYLDTFLKNQIVGRFVALFRGFEKLESRWMDYLSGNKSRANDPIQPPLGSFEDFS